MATLDTSAIAFQLKRVYGNKITDLFNRQPMTYNLFSKSNRKAQVKPAGAGYFFSVRQGAIESVGGRAEGTFLPEPITGDGVQGTISPKLLYGVLRLSGLAIEAGKGNLGAFVDAQGDAVMDTYKALISDLNRQCHGDGYGLLGTLSTTSDTLSTSTTWTVTMDNDRGTRYVRKGMIVDFFESTAFDQSSVASRVFSVNPSTRVVTMEANASTYKAKHPLVAAQSYTVSAATIASGAEMVRYGSRAAVHATTNASYELTGLNGMFDDGTLLAAFEGITVSTDAEWKANILGNSDVNRELTTDLMLSSIDTSAARSDSDVGMIRLGLGQRRKYFGLLEPDVRYAPGQYKGGYEKLTFSQNGAIEMVVDPYTQPNRMYFEPNDAIKKYELTPIGWGGFDPNRMHWRQDYDEGTMYLRTYANLGVEKRTALTLLDDLTEPTSAPW